MAGEEVNFENEFEMYMQQYNKIYSTPEEKQYRMLLFASRLFEIVAEAQYNGATQSELVGFLDDFGYFMDRNATELELVLGLQYDLGAVKNLSIQNLPAKVDWRNNGVVAPVKNQQVGNIECGSCYIFGAVAAAESAYMLQNNIKNVTFSEQEVLDCLNIGRDTCNGGNFTVAFSYMIEHGINMMRDYSSYSAKMKQYLLCAMPRYPIISNIQEKVPQYNLLQLKAAVAQQPVTVGFAASLDYFGQLTKQQAQKGIDTAFYCNQTINHLMTIVGYDNDCFIVRNSWGAYWGDGGYFRVKMTEGTGICQMNTISTYPVLQ